MENVLNIFNILAILALSGGILFIVGDYPRLLTKSKYLRRRVKDTERTNAFLISELTKYKHKYDHLERREWKTGSKE
jgi:hypothetical protein